MTEENLILRFDASDVLEKSIGGRQRRILGGLAAGTTKDFQDEQFLMKGMDFSYLNSSQGKINWDHNPRLIIGRPLQVGMTEKGLYVKGMLSEKSDYPNPTHPDTLAALDQSEWAWDHALRHRADPEAVVPLAWSVEGKKMNKGGMIVKSVVTDVALTDKAVNPKDCTVSAMAKSLRDNSEIINLAIKNGFPIESIVDHETYIKFCKCIGLSVDQSVKFYHITRGL